MCYPKLQIRPTIRKQDDPEGAKVPEYRTLHAIADGRRTPFVDAFLAAVNALKSPDQIRAVEDALQRGDYKIIDSLLNLGEFEEVLTEELQAVISEVVSAAATNSVKYFPPIIAEVVATTGFAFQLANPFVQDYITAHANRLVVDITEQTRLALTVITRRAFEEGLTVREQSKLIFNTVGLYPQQVNALANFRAAQIANGVTGAKLERAVAKKYNELLKYRANMIARTETITASNAGQRLVYDQAVRDGLADAKTLMKRWIVTPDDFLCPYCRELGRQGFIPYDAEWTSVKFGSVKQPTLHPHCRCAVGYEVFLQ